MIGRGRARRHYRLDEWFRLRPVLDILRVPRNQIIDRAYSRRKSPDLEAVRAALPTGEGVNILVTIAFNVPWVIDLLVRSVRRHMPEWTLVVVDNSNDDAKRQEIRALCERVGTPYLGLPPNPEWSPNRSHGIALNWVWRNLLRPAAPDRFGFIDHDCFPVGPNDVMATLDRQPFAGPMISPHRVDNAWFVWAGCMFFDSHAIGNRPLDFNHDQRLRLDTGGRVWHSLYRDLDRSSLTFLDRRMVTIPTEEGAPPVQVDCIGGTLFHVNGVSYRIRPDQASRLEAIIAHVEASLT